MERKILIAEDEATLRFLLAETIKEENYNIFEAENGEEALQMILDIQPDLVLLDVMMPKMTGYQVLEALKEKGPGRKPVIIMLTAKAQQQDKSKGLESGADYFLTKPFSPIDLLDLVESIFANK